MDKSMAKLARPAEGAQTVHKPPSTREFAAGMMRATTTSVLLVDDDDLGRRAMADALTRGGFDVQETSGIQPAMALADQTHFDLVVTELELSDGYADELIRHAKAADPSRPVLVISAVEDEEARMGAFDAGADDVIAKPIAMRELLLRLEAHARIVRATAALQQALRQADHLRLYAAEAAALLAHDLNNGLCIALANADYVGTIEAVASEPEGADAVATVQRTLRRMSMLVRNFVDIARSEDGALKPKVQRTDLSELLATAAVIHQPRGKAAIEVDCDAGIIGDVDATLIERVVHNLLINAVRYADAGGRVLLAARRERTELVITVANSGPTIPLHLRDTLFEKYTTGNDRKAQTGMGLYFCRLACEAHGGTISLGSEPGFSTCFEIRLPQGK